MANILQLIYHNICDTITSIVDVKPFFSHCSMARENEKGNKLRFYGGVNICQIKFLSQLTQSKTKKTWVQKEDFGKIQVKTMMVESPLSSFTHTP